jgi:hypothetical protein
MEISPLSAAKCLAPGHARVVYRLLIALKRWKILLSILNKRQIDELLSKIKSQTKSLNGVVF